VLIENVQRPEDLADHLYPPLKCETTAAHNYKYHHIDITNCIRHVENTAIASQHAFMELKPFGKNPSMDVLLT
jgi:hypothetical protein